MTYGSSDSTSIGAVLYERGPMKQALRSFSEVHASVSKRRKSDSPVSIFLDGDWDLGLDDGIDTSDLVGDLPSALEEQRVVN